MRSFGTGLGYLLLGLAAIMVVLIPFMILDPEAGSGAAVGGFMMAMIFGVPGGLLVWRTTAAKREEERSQRLLGFVYSHDRFTVAELAQKLDLPVGETEARIQELNVQRNLGLAYHPAKREYIHFGRVQQAHQTATHCQSCSASLGHQILFPGEQLTCPYCRSIVVGQHHPAGQPGHAQPGHPGQHGQHGHPGHHAHPGQHGHPGPAAYPAPHGYGQHPHG